MDRVTEEQPHVVEFLRRAGRLDTETWPPLKWRGGGREVWTPEPPD